MKKKICKHEWVLNWKGTLLDFMTNDLPPDAVSCNLCSMNLQEWTKETGDSFTEYIKKKEIK